MHLPETLQRPIEPSQSTFPNVDRDHRERRSPPARTSPSLHLHLHREKKTRENHPPCHYDDAGNLTQTTSPGGNITITQYDNANRPYQVTQPDPGLWNGWPKDHTSQDPPPITPSAEGAPVTLTVYDPNGNVLTVTDAEGNTITNVYDARNRLLKTTDAENIEVEYRYDGRGNRTKVIDGKNQTTEFEYDGLGRNTKTIDPALNAVVFEYDKMRKVARIDAANRRTEYLYDARDRLLDVVYIGDPDENRTYTYDLSGNLLSVTEPGKPDGIADVAYTYDALNRVLTETSNNRTHTYHYDLGGNRLRTEYGGTGRIILSEYDDHNRLSKMVENGRTTFYRYDCEGNIVAKTLPGSQTVAAKFDGLGRRKVITGPGYQFDYAYDMVGNTKRIEEAYSNGLQNRIVDLVYDDIYRLEKETTQVPAIQQTTVTDYTYDDANNRSEKSVNGLAVSYSYNELNQLTSSSGGVYYSYDLHGSRTQRSNGDHIVNYTYDRENRLVSVEELAPDSTPYEGYLEIPWSLSGWPEPSYPVHEDWNLGYVDLSTHYKESFFSKEIPVSQELDNIIAQHFRDQWDAGSSELPRDVAERLDGNPSLDKTQRYSGTDWTAVGIQCCTYTEAQLQNALQQVINNPDAPEELRQEAQKALKQVNKYAGGPAKIE